MSNIHNFTNRQMIEYVSIFPTVASLLDHLLFVIGNGYEFDETRGIIYSGYEDDDSVMYIDEFPEITDAEWNNILKQCHKREDERASMYSMFKSPEKVAEKVAENKLKYVRVAVTDEDFSEESLYQQLLTEAKRYAEEYNDKFFSSDSIFYRPYPFCEDYSKIFKLNQNTPKWFIQITINFCNAWARFLTKEIEDGNVYKGSDAGSRASLEPTIIHRNKIIARANQLSELLK